MERIHPPSRRAWDSLDRGATLVTNNGGGQHACRIRVQRALEHGLDAARLHDATGIHHGDGVSNLCGHTEVMGHENHPHAQFFLQLPQQDQHLNLHRGVQRRRRFIGQEETGPT